MMGDVDIYGVYAPSLFVWMIAAFILTFPVRRILTRCGAYRLIWHRPLFDLALYVVLLGAVVVAAVRTFP